MVARTRRDGWDKEGLGAVTTPLTKMGIAAAAMGMAVGVEGGAEGMGRLGRGQRQTEEA